MTDSSVQLFSADTKSEDTPEQAIWPLYRSGLSRLPVDPASSRELFQQAFHLFRQSGNTAGALQAWSGGVETFLYEMDEFTHLDDWIERLDNLLADAPSFPSQEIEAHVASAMSFALLWRHPDHPELRRWVERSLALSCNACDPNLRIKLYYNAMIYFCWMGEFVKCQVILDEVRKFAGSNAVSPLFMITWKLSEALTFGTCAATKELALESVAEGVEIARDNGLCIMDHMLYAHGVYASLHTGNTVMTGEFLDKMVTSINYNQRNTVAQLNYLQSWHHLLQGNVPQSLAHAERAVDLAVATGTPLPETMCRLVKSLILHAAGETEKTEKELRLTKQLVRRTGSLHFEYLFHLTEALCLLDSGRRMDGLEALRNAMTLGRKQGYATLLLWWRPAAMARLCAIALEENIEVDYVQGLVRKLGLVPDLRFAHVENWPWPVKVRTLGRFSLELSGKPVNFSGKVQEKPLTLLKAIIALGGLDVGEASLSDLLWPNADGDAAYRSCATNLHRLRKLLGQDRALLVQGGKVTLNPAVVWVDALAFDGLTRESHNSGYPDSVAEKALELYGGHFLAGDEAVQWAVSMRERLRTKLLRIVVCEGSRLEESAEWEKAIACYQKGLETDDLVEEFYQRLMFCYHSLGKRGNVLSQYRRCCNVMAVLGLKPSAATRAIYAEAIADPAT